MYKNRIENVYICIEKVKITPEKIINKWLARKMYQKL